jgi:hypothetical protein
MPNILAVPYFQYEALLHTLQMINAETCALVLEREIRYPAIT